MPAANKVNHANEILSKAVVSNDRAPMGGGTSKLEIEGVPPIAVENLLEYCYKDRCSECQQYQLQLVGMIFQIR